MNSFFANGVFLAVFRRRRHVGKLSAESDSQKTKFEAELGQPVSISTDDFAPRTVVVERPQETDTH